LSATGFDVATDPASPPSDDMIRYGGTPEPRVKETLMQIRPTRVKQKLAARQVATILSGTNDPDLIDQLGALDVDGIWLEGEHGGVDWADLGNLTRACDLWGKTSVVRVMDNDYARIYRTLDRGAQGIVVPHVDSEADARAAVEAAKFAPVGKRGMFTSRQGFGVDDYVGVANEQTLLVVLIEDIVAVQNLDAIVKVDHIDVFFVAPNDLATSMGHIGDLAHAEVQRTVDGALTKIVQVRVLLTGFFPWIEAGVKDLLQRAAAGARTR
jgi:4-hydroxy-2-oxoheptanedioate aldolase